MGQVLYRTYRSRGFDEVVGQEHITRTLARAVERDMVAHAYLFTGPRGVGKTSVARILAHVINELEYSDSPNLDIIEIDAASNRRIDDIRDLREKVHIAPISARYKVYIIDEVHMLTTESFNALLKTLEEPPAHVVFILATTEAHKVPATIQSRAQQFHFRPAPVDAVAGHLRHIADREKISIDDEALRLIAERGEGSFRDSISLLGQLSSLDASPITASDIEESLGLAPQRSVDTIIDGVHAGDVAAVRETLRSLTDGGTSTLSLLDQLLRTLSARHDDYELINDLLDVPRSYSPAIKLTSVLMSHTLRHAPEATKSPKPAATPEPKTIAAAAVPAPPVIVAPIKEQKPVAEKAKSSVEWSQVLEAVKSVSSPLYSILSKTQAQVTGDQIRLTFAYSLHHKKLAPGPMRAQLADLITELYGACPEIVTILADRTPTGVAAEVADIMGGGESVHV